MIGQISDLIARGALFVINDSAGKDSQAQKIKLMSMIPHRQLLIIHAVLPEVEWDGTVEHIEANIRDPDAIDTCKVYLDDAIAELQSASRKDAWGGPLAPTVARQVRGARC